MFQGIVSITPRVTISPTTLSTGRFGTTSSATVSATGQNLGGTYSYQWKKTGETCTINTPNSISSTFTGGGIVGFSDVYCDVTYSTTGIKISSPNCTITWTNTGIPITSVTWSIASASTSIYNGTAQSVTVVSTTPAEATYTTTTTSATNATEQASTTIIGNGSYEGTFTSPILTIVTRTISLASSGSTTFIYSGASQSVNYIVSGTVPQDTNWSVSGTSGTNAGNYTATLSETSANYTLGTSTFSWTINPKTISIASSGSTSFAWTGNSQSVGYIVSGTVPEDTAWSVSGTSGTNAGNYTATLSETSANYTLGTSTFSWSITPTAPASFTVTSVVNFSIMNFTWTAVGGCTYQLWGDVEPYSGYSIYVNNITETFTSYAGANQFTYKFYVVAVASSGTSVASRVATVYTGRAAYTQVNPYDSGYATQQPCCLTGSANGDIGLKSFTQGTYGITINNVFVRNCILNGNFSSLLWGTATRTVRWFLSNKSPQNVNFPTSSFSSAPAPWNSANAAAAGQPFPATQAVTGTSGTITYVLRCSGSGWSTNNASGVSGIFWFSGQWANTGTISIFVPADPSTISYSS